MLRGLAYASLSTPRLALCNPSCLLCHRAMGLDGLWLPGLRGRIEAQISDVARGAVAKEQVGWSQGLPIQLDRSMGMARLPSSYAHHSVALPMSVPGPHLLLCHTCKA